MQGFAGVGVLVDAERRLGDELAELHESAAVVAAMPTAHQSAEVETCYVVRLRRRVDIEKQEAFVALVEGIIPRLHLRAPPIIRVVLPEHLAVRAVENLAHPPVSDIAHGEAGCARPLVAITAPTDDGPLRRQLNG